MNWMFCQKCGQMYKISDTASTCDRCSNLITNNLLFTANLINPILEKQVVLAPGTKYEVTVDFYNEHEHPESSIFKALIEEIQQLKARLDKLENP